MANRLRTTSAPHIAIAMVMTFALACSEHAELDNPAQLVESRAGCYDVFPGADVRWMPASWRQVDTTTAHRLRLILSTEPDTSGPRLPAFAVRGGQSPNWFGHFNWWPTSRGLHISMAGSDTEFQMDFEGDSLLLRGTGSGSGGEVGDESDFPVLALRVECKGFVPGFRAGTRTYQQRSRSDDK